MSQLLEILSQKDGYEKTDAFYKYIRKKAWEKGVPLMGSFELTPRCTLDCKMCYVHLEECQMTRDELTTEQWITLIDGACDAGMMYATLTGGECLLYPGFKQIYEHLQSRGVLVSILTNGTLFDEEMIDWLTVSPPRAMQITVYGSSPDGYETVTGNGNAFYQVDKAINLIKESGIPFTLAITLSKQLVDDFEAIYKYCKTKEPLRCDVSTFNFKAREETGRIYDDFAPTLDEQVQVFKTRLNIEGRDFVPFSCEDELFEKSEILNHTKTDNKGITCTAGRCAFSINWKGQMQACNTFPFAEANPLIDGFDKAWQHINKCACEYIMPVECIECKYHNSCFHCPAAHALNAGEGHASSLICEEGKRMALEGIRRL